MSATAIARSVNCWSEGRSCVIGGNPEGRLLRTNLAAFELWAWPAMVRSCAGFGRGTQLHVFEGRQTTDGGRIRNWVAAYSARDRSDDSRASSVVPYGGTPLVRFWWTWHRLIVVLDPAHNISVALRTMRDVVPRDVVAGTSAGRAVIGVPGVGRVASLEKPISTVPVATSRCTYSS